MEIRSGLYITTNKCSHYPQLVLDLLLDTNLPLLP